VDRERWDSVSSDDREMGTASGPTALIELHREEEFNRGWRRNWSKWEE